MVDDRDKKTDYDFATAGETAPGRVPTSNSSAEIAIGGTTKKDKARSADATADLLRELNDARMQLCAQIDALQFLLDGLYEQRQNLDDHITALENMLTDYREHGAFQLGPDGYPADPTAKAAIQAWEEKSGGKFDPHSDAANDFIRLGILEFQNERNGVNSEIVSTSEKLDRSLEALSTLDGIEDRLNSGDYENSSFQHEILAIQEILETKNQNAEQPMHEPMLGLNLNLPSLN